MPGIFVVVDTTGGEGVVALLDGMLDRSKHYPWYVTQRYVDPAAGLALGRLSLGITNQGPQPVRSGDGRMTLVMDGELYDGREQRRALEQAGCRLSGNSHAEILLQGCRRGEKDFLAGVEGKFAAAIWDAQRQRLVVANDRFGMRPVYYAKLPTRLLVASEIKAILADPEVPRQVNLRGIAQFFTFGQYLGDDTSFEAIRVLPPAGWLVFDRLENRLLVDRYWRYTPPAEDIRTQRGWLERLDGAFKTAVDRSVSGTEHLGLSLSGGLDARTILGVIGPGQAELTSVAIGMEGCLDHRFASQLAAAASCRHHNYVLQDEFLNDFELHLKQMVRLTDGQYLSQCLVLPTLPFYKKLGIDVLIRGHGGELMHMVKAYNFSLDRRALRLRDEAELEDWAWRHLRAYMLRGVNGPLLAAQHGDALESLARESLQQCLGESRGIEPSVQRIWHLFLAQRSHRETALSLTKFGSLMETRLPYFGNELVDLLLAAPPGMKLGETIQGYILRRRRPQFLDIVNVNTGSRIGAGAIARTIAKTRQRILAKLRIPGYQPYERLGSWLRRELRPLVGRVLLDDRSLGRGILHPDTVRGVVREHCEGRRNHTFLLLAMMIFEVGQRMFVDQTSAPDAAETSVQRGR